MKCFGIGAFLLAKLIEGWEVHLVFKQISKNQWERSLDEQNEKLI